MVKSSVFIGDFENFLVGVRGVNGRAIPMGGVNGKGAKTNAAPP